MAATKVCARCSVEKSTADFNKKTSNKEGISNVCKRCNYEIVRAWKIANPDKVSEAGKRYHKKHRDRDNARVLASREADREKSRSDARKWREERVAKDPEKAREGYRKDAERRRESDKYRLEDAISSGIRRGILSGSKCGRRTFQLLGYSVDELRAHLERQFSPGMTWGNYGKWHIDHIIPLSAHNYETPDDIDFKKAWALSNLQPLWREDNISKGAKIAGGFQPSLVLRVASNDNYLRKEEIS